MYYLDVCASVLDARLTCYLNKKLPITKALLYGVLVLGVAVFVLFVEIFTYSISYLPLLVEAFVSGRVYLMDWGVCSLIVLSICGAFYGCATIADCVDCLER